MQKGQSLNCANSKDTDQPEHPCSLIMIFLFLIYSEGSTDFSLSGQLRLHFDFVNCTAGLGLCTNEWYGFSCDEQHRTTTWSRILLFIVMFNPSLAEHDLPCLNRPRCLSWMHRPTGDQEVRVQPLLRLATFFHGY